MPVYLNAERLSEQLTSRYGIDLAARRLAELAQSGFIPHTMIDGKGPFFDEHQAVRWIEKNLIVRRKARAFPTRIAVLDFASRFITRPAPAPLAMLSGDLVEFPMESLAPTPCVYFLIRGERVVYVGQTAHPAVRFRTHRYRFRRLGDQGRFDRIIYLPVTKEAAIPLESAFIRILKPELNGIKLSEPTKGDFDLVRRISGAFRTGEEN